MTSVGNSGFSRDADISGKLIFRVSANKRAFLEKYLTVSVPVKNNVSPILSNTHLPRGKFDGTTPLSNDEYDILINEAMVYLFPSFQPKIFFRNRKELLYLARGRNKGLNKFLSCFLF